MFWREGEEGPGPSQGGPRSPKLQVPRLSRRESKNIGGSVKAGLLWKAVGVLAGLEQTTLLLRLEACFLGSFVEDVGHRFASAVRVPYAWANRCVVAEAVENLAAQEALHVLGKEGDAKAVLQIRSDQVSIPVTEGTVSSSSHPSSCSGDLMKFEGDPVRRSGLLHQGVQCVGWMGRSGCVSSRLGAKPHRRGWCGETVSQRQPRQGRVCRCRRSKGCCKRLLCCWKPGRPLESGL